MLTDRSVIWLDANGKATITRLRTGTGAGAIMTALLGVSNADYQMYWEGAENLNGAPAPVSAVYQGNQPFAQIQYICTDGSLATVLLPAPQLGIFMADQETVDVTNAGIITLTTACIAAGGLVSASGATATGIVAGKLLPYRGAP